MDLRGWFQENPRAGFMIYSTLATALVAVVLLTNWPTYHHIIRDGPPVIWYYVGIIALTLPLLCAEPHFVTRLFREPVFWWVAVFLLSGVVWLLLSQDFIVSAMITLNTRIAALGLFCGILLLATEANKRVVALVILGCVAIACATTWYDVLRPNRFVPQGTEYASFGRGAGLFINPNIAASFITMAMLAALPFLPVRLRPLALLGAAVGIVPTFSRSGFIYITLLLVGPLLLGMLGRLQAAIFVTLVAVTVGSIVASYDFLLTASDNVYVHNVVQRLTWFQQGAEVDEAALARMHSAELTWQMFLNDPVIGRGTGASRVEALVPEGPHNMYLMFMGEHGVVGALLYPALIAILAFRGWHLWRNSVSRETLDVGKACILYAVFLFLYGFFSHNVFEEPHGMFALAFLMAAAQRAREESAAPYAIGREGFSRASPVPGLAPNLRRY